jgi:hypothetical protein
MVTQTKFGTTRTSKVKDPITGKITTDTYSTGSYDSKELAQRQRDEDLLVKNNAAAEADYTARTGRKAGWQGKMPAATETAPEGAQNGVENDIYAGMGSRGQLFRNADAIINADQDADMARKSAEQDVPVRRSEQIRAEIADKQAQTKALQQYKLADTKQLAKDASGNYVPAAEKIDTLTKVKNSINSGITAEKPAALDLEKDYTELLQKSGVDDLESSINDLTVQEDDLAAAYESVVGNLRDSGVAQSIISGKSSQAQRNYQEQLSLVSNRKKQLTDQLNTKYSVIDKIMSYKKTSYDEAKDDYNQQFSNQISMINIAKGIDSEANSEEQQMQDNARANANIVYNAISSGAADPSEWDDAQTAQISKLELTAGLPIGFYKSISLKNPKANILSTSTRTTDSGDKYADVIMQGDDGRPTVQSVYLGKEKTTGTTDYEKDQKIISNFKASLTNTKLYNYRAESDGEYRTRESFIKYLKMMYPQIEEADIEQAVYSYYPNR